MIKRIILYELHRKLENSKQISRHARLSSNIISKLTRLLDNNSLSYIFKRKYPYNLIVACNDRYFSIFIRGFTKRIDMLPYKVTGEAYPAKYERGFMTPQGLVNYILRTYGRRKP